MTFIYPITDPEILKLGFGMALYKNRKPEIKQCKAQNLEYESQVIQWQYQSFITYLKEEWKEDEWIYYNRKSRILIEFSTLRNWAKLEDDSNGQTLEIEKVPLNEIFHYYPGQEYNGGIKYVEGKAYCDCGIKVSPNIDGSYFCVDCEKTINPEFEWQEVEEPAGKILIPGMEKSSCFGPDLGPEMTNPAHTQFRKGVKKGEILGIINT